MLSTQVEKTAAGLYTFYPLYTAHFPRSVSGGFETIGVSTHSSTALG